MVYFFAYILIKFELIFEIFGGKLREKLLKFVVVVVNFLIIIMNKSLCGQQL
jgi:hypothetical protein